MNTKNLILIVIAIFLIIALPVSALAVSGVLNNSANTTAVASSTKTVSSNAVTSNTTLIKVTSMTSSINSSNSITSKITSSIVSSNATSKITSASNTISLLEVQKHNRLGSCYIALSGKVYDLSTFQHPSKDDFSVLCGMDITNSEHPRAAAFTSSKVLNYISRYYIGNLGN